MINCSARRCSVVFQFSTRIFMVLFVEECMNVTYGHYPELHPQALSPFVEHPSSATPPFLFLLYFVCLSRLSPPDAFPVQNCTGRCCAGRLSDSRLEKEARISAGTHPASSTKCAGSGPLNGGSPVRPSLAVCVSSTLPLHSVGEEV